MGNVMAFDNLDEMYKHLGKQRERANAMVKPWQRRIGYDNRFMMRIDHEEEEKLFIYTEIPSDWDDVFAEGYPELFLAKHYSKLVKAGEGGSTHLATIDALLTPEQFQRCKAAGWPNTYEAFLRAAYRIPTQKSVCIPYTSDGKFMFSKKDGVLVHAMILGNVPFVGSERQFNEHEGFGKWTMANDWRYAVQGGERSGVIEWMGYPTEEGGWN